MVKAGGFTTGGARREHRPGAHPAERLRAARRALPQRLRGRRRCRAGARVQQTHRCRPVVVVVVVPPAPRGPQIDRQM